jgi:hypothetical protein
MKFFSPLFIFTIAFFACSPAYKFNKDKKAFEASKVISSFKAVADLNDSYFEIKENNYFEFYRQLFDSVKNTRFPGSYKKVKDTFYLTFYDKKGSTLLGNRAVIHPNKKEIVFFK